MQPHFFKTPADFRKWLDRNHSSATELLVGFYKKDSGTPSITWPESVDEALCFGWIDGVRRRIDDVSYSIRFTPRKKTSTWSAINIARVRADEARPDAARGTGGVRTSPGAEIGHLRLRERSADAECRG
jgi:uncharacterized protein YdeI (YjbR/CyaY-like superfamily)